MAETKTTAKIKLAIEGAGAVQQGLGKVEASVNSAGKALLGLAGGLSVAGFAAFVRKGIDAADATSKLAQKTGLLTKEVAGLQLAFDQGGAGEKMQQALSRLSKEAANGNKAFAAMGVEVTGAGGKLKSTRELIGEVSSKFASYADDGKKAALASALFGEKVGADLIPVLNGGAEALAAYDEMALALGLTLDKKTGKSAEQFNDTLDLLSQSTTGVATQLAGKLLPTLNSVASELIGTMTDAKFLSGATDVLSTAFKGLYTVSVGVVQAFKTVGIALGGVGAAIAAVLSGDFSSVKTIVSSLASDIRESWASAAGSVKRVWAETANDTVVSMAAINGAAKRSAPSVQALAGTHKKAASATKEHAEALRALLASAKSSNDAFDEYFAKIEATREAIEGRIRSGREMLEGIQRETAMLGLSNLEREKAIALFELERAGVVRGTEAYAAYADQISQALDAKAGKQAAIDLASDQAKAYKDAIKKQKDENDKFWSSVDSTAHDVFVSVANEGEGAFKRIGKTLKAAVLDMLYQMTIKKWIFQISGSLSGGAGGGGGLSSWVDVGQQAYSYFGGGSAAAGSSAAISAGAGTVNTTSLAGVSAASSGSTGVFGGSTVAASTGTSSSMAAGGLTGYGYMGYAAFIAAAVMVAEKLYESGHTKAALGVGNKTVNTYGTGNTTSAGQNEGQTALYTYSMEAANKRIGEALGLNDKWTDILSGTVRMAALFGRRLKEYGFQADIANGAASVSGYEKYKGGLFRSNKTIQTEVNPADVTAVNSLIQSWTEGTKNMARAMGYSEEAINSYTGTLRINFKGAKTGEQIAERYAEAQEKLQREMLSAASGTKLTKEAFASMMEGINASIQNAGISAQGIGDILAQGAIGRLTQAQVGEQLSEVIIGGIYNTIAQNAMAPVAQIFVDSIITPIFTAIAAGVPISQAISQASIDSMVASANAAAETLNYIFSLPEFQQSIDTLRGAIRTIAGVSVSSARHVRAYGSAVSSAASAAAQAAQAAAQELYGLETQLLNLLGDTTRLRERELNALSAGNRALQERIWAIEDSKEGVDAALAALRVSTEKETERLGNQLDAMRDVESTLNDIFSTLRDNIRDLRGEVESTSTMQAAQALALIRNAASTGVVPDGEALSEAIDSARSAMEATQFATRFDRDRAYLTLANDLASLQSVVEPQLGSAEQQIVLLQENIDALNLQLNVAEDAVNALYKIDTSVLSVAAAMHSLAASMGVYAQAVAQGAAVPVASSAPKEFSKYASGGAFTNGIVTRPTFFDQSQMGERGSEGILPLANIGGKLGVHAQGGGSDPELKALVRELIDRVKSVETQTTKTAETNRDLRVLAEKADNIGIKQRGENVI